MKLILASSSPRRRELLARLGQPFDVVPSRVPERSPRPGESATSYAIDLARAKAIDVRERHPSDAVLSADTVVVVDREILGKPEDTPDAVRMLSLLGGRSHRVVTGVALYCPGAEHEGSVEATVRMRAATADEIEHYVATGEPLDKAGAYAVQGKGGDLVDRVDGCYETVVGLPLCLVAELLRKCGIAPAAPSCDCRRLEGPPILE